VISLPLLDRLVEIRDKRRTEGILRQNRVGGGQIIKKTTQRVDKITTRVKTRTTKIIPNVTETLGKWNVGSRVTEIVSSIGEGKAVTSVDSPKRKKKVTTTRTGTEISIG